MEKDLTPLIPASVLLDDRMIRSYSKEVELHNELMLVIKRGISDLSGDDSADYFSVRVPISIPLSICDLLKDAGYIFELEGSILRVSLTGEFEQEIEG